MVCNIGVIESSQAISTTDLHKACKISIRLYKELNEKAFRDLGSKFVVVEC